MILPVVIIAVAVPRLLTLALPVTFNVPATLTPVPVATKIFALPATVVETLPLAVRVILLLPLCSKPLLIVVILPVVIIAVAVPKLLTLALPVTDKVPAVIKFPPVMFPVATINPAVPKLPTLALLVTFNKVVDRFPVAALNDKLALLPIAKLPVLEELTNVGKNVPVVCVVTTSLSLTFALATYKLGTSVVDVIIRGGVPIAILEINCVAEIVLDACTLLILKLPSTVNVLGAVKLKVNPESPLKIPELLNCTMPLEPPIAPAPPLPLPI